MNLANDLREKSNHNKEVNRVKKLIQMELEETTNYKSCFKNKKRQPLNIYIGDKCKKRAIEGKFILYINIPARYHYSHKYPNFLIEELKISKEFWDFKSISLVSSKWRSRIYLWW